MDLKGFVDGCGIESLTCTATTRPDLKTANRRPIVISGTNVRELKWHQPLGYLLAESYSLAYLEEKLAGSRICQTCILTRRSNSSRPSAAPIAPPFCGERDYLAFD
jgi:hypothetical protein